MTTGAHPHHWRIDPPDGATSHGVCLTCGAERDDFKNGPQENRPHENGWVAQSRAKKRTLHLEDAEMQE